ALECPTCRERLPSKRNLRPDPAFDALVKAIFPNPEELEQREERELAKITASFDQAGLAKQVADGLARQARAPPPPLSELRPDTSPQLPRPSHGRPAKRARQEADPRRRSAPDAAAP